MATAKKEAAPAAPKKPAAKKVAKVSAIKVTKAPAASRGRAAQHFKYTGKQLGETTVKTPQFQALIISMQDIEATEFNRDDFTMQQVADLGVQEGHISMPNTKNPEKQKKRIIACYKKALIDEGFIVQL